LPFVGNFRRGHGVYLVEEACMTGGRGCRVGSIARGPGLAAPARAAAAVVALLVAAAVVLSGCGGSPAASGGSSNTLTPASGSAGVEPAALDPSDPSTSPAAVTHTVMKQFAPLDENGQLTAAAEPGGSGSCFATSIAVPLSGVYRCLSQNTILDPCFAPAKQKVPSTVVCFGDPWSDGTILSLTGSLPAYNPDLQYGNPWAIELGNGARCVAVTGAVPVLDDIDLTYRCVDGSVAGLTTDDSGEMAAHYGPASGPLQDVGVLTAWRGRSYRLAG
jgi:hypothetical protein